MKCLVTDLDLVYSKEEIIENEFYYKSFEELFITLAYGGIEEDIPQIIFIYMDEELTQKKAIAFPFKEYSLWLKFVIIESLRWINMSKEKKKIIKTLDEKYLS